MAATEAQGPRDPFTPQHNATWFKVYRRNVSESGWDECTIYDAATRAHTGRIPVGNLDGPGIREKIFEQWGSGTYHLRWYAGPGARAGGKTSTQVLDDPERPKLPAQGAGPELPNTRSPFVPSSENSSYARERGSAAELDLKIQLEALQKRFDRAQAEWELERARIRDDEERLRDRERDQSERRRRQDEEEARARADERDRRHNRDIEDLRTRHDRELHEIRRAHERELEDVKRKTETSGGFNADNLEELLETMRDDIKKDVAEQQKGMLSQVLELVKAVAPGVLAALGKAGPPGAPQTHQLPAPAPRPAPRAAYAPPRAAPLRTNGPARPARPVEAARATPARTDGAAG